MSKKVGKFKLKQMEKRIENGENAMKRARRNTYLFTATFVVADFLLGFFISALRFSFAGLENIAFVMLWIGIFFAVFATFLFSITSLDDYYREKNELDNLKEEYEKMEV